MKIELAPVVYQKKLQYEEAWLYCMCLHINGKSDWRMPNFHHDFNSPELETIDTWIDVNEPWTADESLDLTPSYHRVVPVRTV